MECGRRQVEIITSIIILRIIVFRDRNLDRHPAVESPSCLVDDGVVAEGFVVIVPETQNSLSTLHQETGRLSRRS